MRLLPGEKVFVAYTWEWQDYCNNDSEEPEEHEDPAESSQSEDEPDPFDSGFVTHTITFKCIGASRDDKQQETLQAAAKCIKEGKEVPIRLMEGSFHKVLLLKGNVPAQNYNFFMDILIVTIRNEIASCVEKAYTRISTPEAVQPEPDNPVDCNAIAFQCCVHNDWSRVGYVVQEALPEVHDAIQKHAIVSVRFAWVKFLLCWSRCGPGFYAGINIGSWSRACIQCASTR